MSRICGYLSLAFKFKERNLGVMKTSQKTLTVYSVLLIDMP